jgi:hypothetical protein
LILLGIVLLGVTVSLFRYFSDSPSLEAVLNVLVMILLWVPLKGALLRFMGGARPYRSALAANASSELLGLGFPLSGLGQPWTALGASLVLSTVIEGFVLAAMATASVKLSFVMALYLNVFAHLLVAGLFLWPGSRLAGGAVIFGAFLIFILPIFVVPRPPSRGI